VTDPAVDLFDREAVFIDRVLIPLRRDFPALKIVFEHITTREAAQYVAQADARTAATITAHHLLHNRNALFQGGIRPHYYCLPLLKRETHRQALLRAAVSGSPKFFLGTDSAPHPVHLKEADCGCAGCYTAHAAIELYAQAFESADALDKLEAFASFHGADFYGLPRNAGTITLLRQPWTPPPRYAPGDAELTPLGAGQSLVWRLRQPPPRRGPEQLPQRRQRAAPLRQQHQAAHGMPERQPVAGDDVRRNGVFHQQRQQQPGNRRQQQAVGARGGRCRPGFAEPRQRQQQRRAGR